jgi:hypothetical protein
LSCIGHDLDCLWIVVATASPARLRHDVAEGERRSNLILNRKDCFVAYSLLAMTIEVRNVNDFAGPDTNSRRTREDIQTFNARGSARNRVDCELIHGK